MIYTQEKISPKDYEGNIVFLYGDETAERSLPLGKKEVALVKERREECRDFIVSFDRLPYRLYVVSFDSEKAASEVQEGLRRKAMELLKRLETDKVAEIAVCGEGTLPEEMAALLEGFSLADYSFDRYKGKEPWHLEKATVDSVYFKAGELEAMQRLWNRIYWCREWVNLPVQDLNAEAFADELAAIAADLEGVTCTVMDKRQIESLRMGGLLAVNRGSVDEPRFVVLEYDGVKGSEKGVKRSEKTNVQEGPIDGEEGVQGHAPQSLRDSSPNFAPLRSQAVSPSEPGRGEQICGPICLVGKGVMYDTGGLNIKPEDYMQEMKSDMAGAATMASVLFAAADNRLPVHLVALLPLTDSRPGGNAYAADDILTMYDGTTVEVVNTDAEGRLILADAIAYAVKNYHPRVVIDAATLTGAAVRAISTFGIAAMEQNGRKELEMLKLVGEQVYERLVEFPMWKEYDELIKSEYADLRNCGTTPQAGTITAGKFLAHFAKETPYVHLDIAGVAYFSKGQHCWKAGASGYGVRLLYAYLQMQ